MTDFSPQMVAASLAKELNIPSWKGAVWVSERDGKIFIVVACDPDWLACHEIPKNYLGYDVDATDRFLPKVTARRN